MQDRFALLVRQARGRSAADFSKASVTIPPISLLPQTILRSIVWFNSRLAASAQHRRSSPCRRHPASADDDLASAVQPARVHRRLYTDPAIFELEMERIFGVAWLYVGHESQVRNPGDYFLTQVGRKAMVVTRDETGKLRVLHNQCAHRGAMVVATERATPRNSPCVLSRLDLSPRRPAQGGAAQPRLSAGFRHQESEDRDAAGAARRELSRLRLRQPGGRGPEPEGIARPHDDLDRRHGRPRAGRRDRGRGRRVQHAYNANWKLYFENLCDAAHPLFTHRSSIDAAQQQIRRRLFRRHRRDRDPADAPERRALLVLGERRSASGPIRTAIPISATITTTPSSSPRMKDPVFRDYIAALEKKKGKDETRRILEVRRWNSNIYPNVSLMSQFQQLRVVHPIAVNRTVVQHLQLPAQGRAGADVPQHHQLRQYRQRHRLAGADRRSRNLQPHRHRACRATAPTGCEVGRGYPERRAATSTADGRARIRPAKSISATCSTPGAATCWARRARGAATMQGASA